MSATWQNYVQAELLSSDTKSIGSLREAAMGSRLDAMHETFCNTNEGHLGPGRTSV